MIGVFIYIDALSMKYPINIGDFFIGKRMSPCISLAEDMFSNSIQRQKLKIDF